MARIGHGNLGFLVIRARAPYRPAYVLSARPLVKGLNGVEREIQYYLLHLDSVRSELSGAPDASSVTGVRLP